jgi:hypothetical protein
VRSLNLRALTMACSACMIFVVMTASEAQERSLLLAQSKYGIEDLPEWGQKEIWEQVNYWARDEVNLEVCGYAADTMNRMTAAGRSCMPQTDPKSIDRVRDFFDNKKREWETLVKAGHKFDCSEETITQIKRDIEETAADIGSCCSKVSDWGPVLAIPFCM